MTWNGTKQSKPVCVRLCFFPPDKNILDLRYTPQTVWPLTISKSSKNKHSTIWQDTILQSTQIRSHSWRACVHGPLTAKWKQVNKLKKMTRKFNTDRFMPVFNIKGHYRSSSRGSFPAKHFIDWLCIHPSDGLESAADSGSERLSVFLWETKCDGPNHIPVISVSGNLWSVDQMVTMKPQYLNGFTWKFSFSSLLQ